jgi:hypothetical protein
MKKMSSGGDAMMSPRKQMASSSVIKKRGGGMARKEVINMATSGTTTFNLDIDDVIEDAYERCGFETRSGYDLKSARRSLNILFQEWMNRGIHFGK